jgi:hypothetical protein
MKRAGLALVAALLTACSPPQQQQADSSTGDAPPPILAGCTAQASHDWSAVGSQYYLVEAEAHGDTCAEAVATIRIKSRDGSAVLFTRDYPIREVSLAFNPNGDQTSLRSDLEGWIVNTADPATADTLPAWPNGAARPPGFEPAVPRNRYEGARGNQGPLFCYPDGGESNACIAMAGNTATFLGSLTPERL